MTRTYAIAYVATAIAFLALDAVWLGTMAGRLYRPGIGHLMQDGFSFAPALVFYLLYVGGMVFFAVAPGIDKQNWLHALGFGAALGLVAYATFGLTNQAVLRDWPWHVTALDMAWGTFATGTASAIATAVVIRWFPNSAA
ncbi:DUF2177 family protein [Paracidovorax konjaci]|uniref:Uncharacterized membrane protein n=1 Tax=Paracidovorax konjaci TaxID=32040 RepID=A0A1I1XTV0_9BURK|nr:DUF2177 family protein [Paracidovorax konjaci]SFE10714.1 Uncharacterized membrane protein [Paracidovorax konjaci]